MRKRRKAAEATFQAEASSLAGAQFYLVQSSFRGILEADPAEVIRTAGMDGEVRLAKTT
jgi:hypothetical protein